jgi:hypothetical protein
MARLFLDSNVLVRGLVVPWSFDRVVLKYCAVHLHRLVYAVAVKIEVEHFLLRYADRYQADWLLADYDKFIQLARPEEVPYPDRRDVEASRALIRHAADVPVLVSAMQSAPDWLLTNNTDHFTPAVAARTGLRIAEPEEFIRATHL